MARRFRGAPAVLSATLAVLAFLVAAPPAPAANDRTVERFLRLSDRFQARLPNSDIAALSRAQRRERAVCIVSRFESGYGAAGVRDLMDLMSVLSKGAEFDDPTIIAFNEEYGRAYDRTVRECTRSALNS